MVAGSWRHINFSQPEDVVLERAGHAAVVSDSSIYVIGGRKGRIFYNDVLRYDTLKRIWEKLPAKDSGKFAPRGNHTATLVDREIWVIGGSDNETIFSDVCVYNVDKRTWRFPIIKENANMLCRSAHGADIHPRSPKSIIIMGGYGGISSTYVWTNDTLILHTDRLVLESVVIHGHSPSPRGYHTLTTLGSHCFVIGGRTEEGRIQGRQMVAVYDTDTSTWILPPRIEGVAPPARSSHRAVALQDRIVIHGGAASEKDPDRLSDIATLLVPPFLTGLEWSACDQVSQQPSHEQPKGRAAHTASLVGSTMYILCGYTGHAGTSKYIADCWALDLPSRAQEEGLGGRGSGAAHSKHALQAGGGAAAESAVPFITKPSTRGSGGGAAATATAKVQHRQPGSPMGHAGSKRGPPSPHAEQPAGKRPSGGNVAPSVLHHVQWQSAPAPADFQPGPKAAALSPGPGSRSQPHVVDLSSGQGMPTGLAQVSAAVPATADSSAQVSRLEAELQQLRSQLAQQQQYKSYQLLEVELKHLREQRGSLTVQLATTTQGREERERQCTELQTQLAAANAELTRCQARLGDREQAAAAAERLQAHVTAELSTAREHVTQLQQSVLQLEAKLEERQRDLDSERQTRTRMQDTVTSLTKTLEQLQLRLNSEEQALMAARSALGMQQEQAQRAAREQEAAHEATRQELRMAQARLASSGESLTQAKAEIAAAQLRCKAAEEVSSKAEVEKRQLEGELQVARQQMQALRDAGRTALDWYRHFEAQVKGGAPAFMSLAGAGAGVQNQQGT